MKISKNRNSAYRNRRPKLNFIAIALRSLLDVIASPAVGFHLSEIFSQGRGNLPIWKRNDRNNRIRKNEFIESPSNGWGLPRTVMIVSH
jgi:hypothetical protein